MKKLSWLIMLLIGATLLFFAICLFSCSKPKEQPAQTGKYSVTFEVKNPSACYFISIHDATNLNDFSDTIRTATFSKTITYNYSATYRCYISNRAGVVSNKEIKITYNTKVITCQDNMYPSLDCFIVP